MTIIENNDAQFMLLAGFIIAISLVATTVMLSSIIFESNVAGEAGADSLKYDVVNLMQISAYEMKSAYRSANGTNNSQKIANFSKQMQNFSANLPKIYALHGEGVKMSWDVSNWNNNLYANFTENGMQSGPANWTVMESVKNISIFELRNVSGLNFEVNVSNQTTGVFLWSMKLSATDNISIKNASGSISYYTVNYTYINLLNTTWPSQYKFGTNVGTNITKLTFLNGSNARGRFNLTGNTSYGTNFTRSRDYILNATVTFSTSRMGANITIPVSVPW